jgi:hypothetical protein
LLHSILPPNTLYATVAVEDCVITGGHYLSSYTLTQSLYGLVHSVMLGSSVADPDDIVPGLYIRRLVHYFHTAYVVNNLLDTGKKDFFCKLIQPDHLNR